MGLFDEVVIHPKLLPQDAPEFVRKCPVFQTYDLGRGMGKYTIREDGILYVDRTMLSTILEEIGDSIGVPKTIPPQPQPCLYKRKRLKMSASNLRGGAPRKGEYIHFTENGEDYIDVGYTVQIRDGRVSSIKEKYRDVKPARPLKEM